MQHSQVMYCTLSNHDDLRNVTFFIIWTMNVFPQFCILGLCEIIRSKVPFLLWPADPGQTVSLSYEGSVTL